MTVWILVIFMVTAPGDHLGRDLEPWVKYFESEDQCRAAREIEVEEIASDWDRAVSLCTPVVLTGGTFIPTKRKYE